MRTQLLLAVALLAACDTELPPASAGGAVEGSVRYDGEAHLDFASPVLTISAFASFPPEGPPHAAMVIPEPDFSAGALPYRLANLPAYAGFKVFAQLQDRGVPDDLSAPFGAYPDTCSFASAEGSGVAVSELSATEGIDIVIFDDGGAEDPCNDGDNAACPQPGMASLEITLLADGEDAQVGPDDILVLALFPDWEPSGPPTRFQSLAGDAIAFPLRLVDNGVPSGEHSLYACLAREGRNIFGVCDQGDVWRVYDDGAPLRFDAGMVVQLELDLSSALSPPPGVAPAGDDCR